MAKKNTNTVTINGTEHNYDDLNDTQKVFLSDVVDLERKITSAQAHLRNFNIDQLKMGRMAFMNALTASLSTESEETEAVN